MSLLDVQNVSVRFGGIVALDGLSFTIDEGQICGLIGPNGAGKTTMFNVVSRIYQPTEGRVLFDGDDLLRVPAHGIARHGIARTFQNLALFPSHDAARERDGRRPLPGQGRASPERRCGSAPDSEERRIRDEAGELLVRLGLGAPRLPAGAGLPFGTLKRLEIARALAAKPTFL